MKYRRSIRDIPRMKISEFYTDNEKQRHHISRNIETTKESIVGGNIENRNAVVVDPIEKYSPLIGEQYSNTIRSRNVRREREERNRISRLPIRRGERKKSIEENDDVKETLTLLKKVGISAVICLTIIAFKSIDTPITNDIIQGVKTSITSQFDIDKTLGKLKFVSNYFPDAASVFADEQEKPPEQLGGQIKLIAPVEGKVISKFGKTPVYNAEYSKINEGVDIEGKSGDSIYAAADGEVINVDKNNQWGNYIRIKHGSDYETIYGNCGEALVKVGDKVKQKDIIGKINTSAAKNTNIFHFEVRIKGQAIDPLNEIDEKSKVSR